RLTGQQCAGLVLEHAAALRDRVEGPGHGLVLTHPAAPARSATGVDPVEAVRLPLGTDRQRAAVDDLRRGRRRRAAVARAAVALAATAGGQDDGDRGGDSYEAHVAPVAVQ